MTKQAKDIPAGIRPQLHEAYAYVRGVEANTALSALTLDHMIQAQIDRLKKGSTTSLVDGSGNATDSRASRWDRIDAIGKNLKAAVQQVLDAGSDQAKLAQLGIYDTDQSELSDDVIVLQAEANQ